MRPLDLVETARCILRARNGKPTQANLRRAHSTAYYALFHCIAREAADTIIGGAGATRSLGAWRQTYRALEHVKAKDACRNRRLVQSFPKAIEDFANAFVAMQEKRHAADYDPAIRLTKSEVSTDIDLVFDVINAFKAESTKDRKAFCVLLLFRARM